MPAFLPACADVNIVSPTPMFEFIPTVEAPKGLLAEADPPETPAKDCPWTSFAAPTGFIDADCVNKFSLSIAIVLPLTYIKTQKLQFLHKNTILLQN